MKQTFRWYGPKNDPVSLLDIKQAGAQGIVTALHHIPSGQVWSVDEIKNRQKVLSEEGFHWDVVESVNIHDDIKTKSGNYKLYIENYKQTIINLASCGIHTICYNFMPVLDWTRTNLALKLQDGSEALYFEFSALAAFDCFILKREHAENDYNPTILSKAKTYFESLTNDQKEKLKNTILAGLPGTKDVLTIEQFNQAKAKFDGLSREDLQSNYIYFLEQVIPTAEEHGVNLCVHPDDPPFSVLGIPRITSTLEDFKMIFDAVPSRNNGLTFCTGALGARRDNNLEKIFSTFSDRVHFIHLRSTKSDEEGNFFEADHLDGDVNMYNIVKLILEEEKRRKNLGYKDAIIPFRPDHGHQMLDDLGKDTHPGYAAIGRLRGLAEIRGLELGIKSALNL